MSIGFATERIFEGSLAILRRIRGSGGWLIGLLCIRDFWTGSTLCQPGWDEGEKHTSGVETPFPRGRCVAGDESPAYRSGLPYLCIPGLKGETWGTRHPAAVKPLHKHDHLAVQMNLIGLVAFVRVMHMDRLSALEDEGERSIGLARY
jgi:hypothetical protein